MSPNQFVLTLFAISAIFRLANAACEDIQSLMDGTLREDCNSTQKIRGNQICVPFTAGPLILETRPLSSQPLAMRSYADQQYDSRILIGYYPKWDKCFIIKRTNCAIKGAVVDSGSRRIYWIELCPTGDRSGQNGVSLHRINLDGSGYISTGMQEMFENWFSLELQIDSVSRKLYVLTYSSVLECDLEGQNCVPFDRPTEDALVSFAIDSHQPLVNTINPRG